MLPDANNEAGPSKPQRLRANRACENCRLRKIRCSGESPCQACISTAIGDSCFVRAKARPGRGPPAKIVERDQRLSNAMVSPTELAPVSDPRVTAPQFPNDASDLASYWSLFGDQTTGSDHINQLSYMDTILPHLQPTLSPEQYFERPPVQHAPPAPPSVNPLTTLEGMLAEWCDKNGVALQPLLFNDEARIACLEPTPLPHGEQKAEFEDELMRSLVSAEDVDHLQIIDSARLIALYSRYRALPQSPTGDQTALIYASLCLARHIQLRNGVAGGMVNPKTSAREDVTYYRLARSSLSGWGRSSTASMCALFCMVMWVQIHGGAAEYREITSHWAWQIRNLGLHKRATAQLYPPQDMSETLLASYCFSETLRAIMTDLKPAIPLAELELGSNGHPNGVIDCITRASNHAVKFLRDYADPHLDITTANYLGASEELWSEDLEHVRGRQPTALLQVKHGWAEMRLHWLRFLLHIPRMASTPGRACQATIYALRAASHILNIHSEAAQLGMLDPSWLQLKRVLTCGQVIILCFARGEVHQLEAVELFSKLLSLIRAHVDFWPVAEQAVHGYQIAAARLGIHLPNSTPNATTGPADRLAEPLLFPDLGMDSTLTNWSGLFLDLDMDAFALNGDAGTA